MKKIFSAVCHGAAESKKTEGYNFNKGGSIMNELFETMVADASAFDDIDAKKGSELSSLIRNSQQLSNQIKEAEQHLKDLKAMRHKAVSYTHLTLPTINWV